ncbi:MAG TPA: hypothetical protein PKN72_09790, partial [Nitrosomonas europaea]|nr:hypothetical protein [Nitrosomonas europaea]
MPCNTRSSYIQQKPYRLLWFRPEILIALAVYAMTFPSITCAREASADLSRYSIPSGPLEQS